jgi:hypothetical protein
MKYKSDVRKKEYRDTKNYRLVQVSYGLRYIKGNQLPYFFAVGSAWEYGNLSASPNVAGYLSDLREIDDELKPFVQLHLSDTDGVPIHAIDNGWYWYHGGKLETCADALRVKLSDLPTGMESKKEFSEFVDTLRPTWKELATETILKHDLKYTE